MLHAGLDLSRKRLDVCLLSDSGDHLDQLVSERLEIPEPWRSNITASLALIDDLERQIDSANKRLKEGHADHPYIPLLRSAPGIGWVLAFTIASEDRRDRALPKPAKARRLHRPMPPGQPVRRQRSPRADHQARPYLPALGDARGDHACAQAPRLLRALPAHEAPPRKASAAPRSPRSTPRGGSPNAVWHMLTRNENFAPRGATFRLAT